MGLDVTFYKNVVLADVGPELLEGDSEDIYEKVEYTDYLYLYPNMCTMYDEIYPNHNIFTSGIYDAECVGSVTSKSYSGYGKWRNELAIMAGYTSARDCWEAHTQGPFYELIHFSDCEGLISGSVVGKLHKDFVEYEAKAKENNDPYFKSYYQEWLNLLGSIVGQNCLIHFH